VVSEVTTLALNRNHVRVTAKTIAMSAKKTYHELRNDTVERRSLEPKSLLALVDQTFSIVKRCCCTVSLSTATYSAKGAEVFRRLGNNIGAELAKQSTSIPQQCALYASNTTHLHGHASYSNVRTEKQRKK
jgi:hypothetical protein